MDTSFCAIDFETACYSKASICAVGLARIRDGQVVDTFYSLVKPPEGMEIMPYFTRIHGIRNFDVRNAPDFLVVWTQISDFIGNDSLVAHNSGFDRSVLKAAVAHHGIQSSLPEFECTVQHARRAWPELANHRLDTVSDFLGIKLKHHEALSDAIACARIFIAACS